MDAKYNLAATLGFGPVAAKVIRFKEGTAFTRKLANAVLADQESLVRLTVEEVKQISLLRPKRTGVWWQNSGMGWVVKRHIALEESKHFAPGQILSWSSWLE